MKNWEVLQKKISEMSEEEFVKFIIKNRISILDVCRTIDVEWDCDEFGKCIGHTSCVHCVKTFLREEYQSKQEKWIVHRTLRRDGLEYYVCNKRALEGVRPFYNLGNVDYKPLCSICHKKYAEKFNKDDALVVRDLLNLDRAGKQYLWVISKVEE